MLTSPARLRVGDCGSIHHPPHRTALGFSPYKSPHSLNNCTFHAKRQHNCNIEWIFHCFGSPNVSLLHYDLFEYKTCSWWLSAHDTFASTTPDETEHRHNASETDYTHNGTRPRRRVERLEALRRRAAARNLILLHRRRSLRLPLARSKRPPRVPPQDAAARAAGGAGESHRAGAADLGEQSHDDDG